jgi:hypothetical protein
MVVNLGFLMTLEGQTGHYYAPSVIDNTMDVFRKRKPYSEAGKNSAQAVDCGKITDAGNELSFYLPKQRCVVK